MGQLGDILVGGVDDENSTAYPEDPDETTLTWKQDTSGNYYLCENSDYIIRPIWPATHRVLWIHKRKDFDDLDEAKAWVETRVRAGL